MGKEKVVEVEKSEMEDGEVKTHTDDDIGAEEEDEEEEEEEEEVGATAGPARKEVEEHNDRDGEADSEETMRQKKKKRKRRKKKLLLQQQKKIISKAGSKVKESETASDREVLKGSPRRKVVKEEPKDPEESKSLEDENGKMNGNGRRDGKWNKSERLATKKSPVKRQSVEEHSSKSETEDEEDKEDKVDGEENGNEDEKSEEEGRMEAEKDLALTMSSSWAPLSERERESLKVSKSGREEREKETETYREVQSESFKERVRAREDDVELSKEKSRLKKQKLSDPPLLSLSLPDTSLHLASSEPSGHGTKSKSKSSGPVPKAASENERSFRSFGPTQSQSNGYTNSLSLSLSHQFFHNPSCSLTQNSFDDKEGTTCSSRQVSLLRDDPTEGSRGSSFGGREHFFHMASDGSHDRSKYRRELPLYQKLLQSGNTQSLQGPPGNGEGTRDSSRSFMDERPMEPLGNPLRDTEGSIGGNSQGSEQFRWKDEGSLASGCIERSRTSHDRPWTIHRDTRERHRQDGWSSPSQSGSVQERLYDQRKLSGRERRPDADAGRELSLSGSRGFAERDEESAGHEKGVIVVEEDSAGVNNSRKVERSWLHDIATEPIPRIASKLQEVPESFLESLKKCLQDTLGSSKRKDDFVSLQRTLQRRSDLTTDTLLQSHRTQLEILVAMKTGIPAFLHPDMPLTTAALTEIFVGSKCRNALCQSQLPADDCECKVCSSKGGFCNACMCVVCSKFDFDSNTCRWIGCDFCLHWCHSDCGIQMGHISSGVSTRGTSGDSVMQFRCIGCDHTSELYGFVKDVFTTCAKDWPMDVLARELQCVRRIFHRSEDLRGKQLFGKAEQLLAKLESSRDVEAVCQSMLKFFAAGEKEAAAPRANSGADVARDAIPLSQEREMTSRLADAVRDAIHVIKAPNGDGTDLEKARAALEFFDQEVEEKRHEASELQHERAWQRAQIEELENIVQIKQAEAKMFQMRADEVRREAEGLQRIVQAKNEKIEEEYKQKLTKLRLTESEERRHKWSDEVQTLEKTHREYSAMKMSMVSDIRELLKTVEAAKAQLS